MRQHTQHAMPCSAQNWLQAIYPDFVTKKNQLPPDLPNINPVDYHVWGAMLEAYVQILKKLKTIAEVKEALQVIWGNLPQGLIDKAVNNIRVSD